MTGAAISCERCGAVADTQDKFCGTCGEFLNWDAAEGPAADPPQSPATAAPGDESRTPDPPASPVTGSPDPVEPPAPPIRAAQAPPPPPVGIVCGTCETDNDPKRNFCVHCGTALRAAGPAPNESRRERRRRRRERPAGYRPGPRRKPRIRGYLLVAVLVAAVLVLLAAFPARPIVAPWMDDLRDRITAAVPVTPAAVAASSASTGADRAFDGLSNRYWAPDSQDGGAGEWIEAEFADPVRLVYLVFSPGIARNQEEFLSQARPKLIELEISTADGEVESRQFTVADSAEPQTFRLGVSDVTKVRLTILSAHGFETGRMVAIAELEYFIRS